MKDDISLCCVCVCVQVSLEDGGSYFCSAENGLGHTEKEELVLDVQYGPQVGRNISYHVASLTSEKAELVLDVQYGPQVGHNIL